MREAGRIVYMGSKRRIERLTKAMQKQIYIHFVVVVKVFK